MYFGSVKYIVGQPISKDPFNLAKLKAYTHSLLSSPLQSSMHLKVAPEVRSQAFCFSLSVCPALLSSDDASRLGGVAPSLAIPVAAIIDCVLTLARLLAKHFMVSVESLAQYFLTCSGSSPILCKKELSLRQAKTLI